MQTYTSIGLVGLGLVAMLAVGDALGRQAPPDRASAPSASAASPTFRWIEEDLGGGLRLEAESYGHQWTGVAATPDNDLIVCYPVWGGPHEHHVARLHRGVNRPMPWPSWGWNHWPTAHGPEPLFDGKDAPSERLVCVQSVVAAEGVIWVLDPANPEFAGVKDNGPKLLGFNAATGEVMHWIRDLQDDAELPDDAYLNDVRFDARRQAAYITDSGAGGLVVFRFGLGAKRRLANHPSTRADPEFIPVIGGRQWRVGDTGPVPQIHADGIALSPDGEWLYWQALTGARLHRAPTAALLDFSMPEDELAKYVEDLGVTGMTDGMIFDRRGNLYFSALEHDAVVYRTPAGEMKMLVRHELIEWPDSFSIGPDDRLYFTTAQIHDTPNFNPGRAWPGPDDPYRIFSAPLAGAGDNDE